ncbi:nitrile hydratase subunit beta [Ancylobacter sp. MQZ15Z-1]|uniref:Nitrile hydratase subunit beta n=1 Tax=Ancylobacter mangrovi TaxID=2972472 RepID=A0A9X2T2F9_9HYPH|nr:nitrile hydratase subunit beta [Ancylobacter mangrovi]MCS0495832.1 nitrile hydratase subunit beta [Ancylobacter mangrovi]
MTYGPEEIVRLLDVGATTRVDPPPHPAPYEVGQVVVTRNLHPRTHTRLPRYCRGKRGEIVRVHGMYALPDRRALGDESTPEYCYSVRFTMRELWGEEAPARDSLLIDLWDSYLEPAGAEER